MDQLGVGLIGCGRLAERGYVEAIRRARGVRLVALADPDETRRVRLANGVPTYADAEGLIGAGAAEAVILATPAAAHLEDATLASAAGLPALVEKPPAANADDAAAMAALDRPPAFGFNRRFEPGIARLCERVPSSGELEIAIALHHTRGSWDSYEVSDDALLTLGPHLIDLALWLSGSAIEQVRALELDPNRAELELSLGRGRARISCSSDSSPIDVVEVRGGERMHAAYSAGGRLRRGLRRLRRPIGAGALIRSLALQLEAFACAALGRGTGELATAEDGLAVMRAIEAARHSAGSGGNWHRLNAPASATD
jgi:myo-inositol 2-dehydrogenase/D-chiro-inositol 1-dehydrogenase